MYGGAKTAVVDRRSVRFTWLTANGDGSDSSATN